MASNDIWTNFIEKGIISHGIFGSIYKGINKQTGNYVGIKEINKLKYKKLSGTPFNEEEIEKKINLPINTTLKETINTEKNFYIIMDLAISNLEDFLKMRESPFSIIEIKEILNQLNEDLKIKERENIIMKDMKLSNILIFLNKINKITIKLSDFDSSKFSDRTKVNSINLEEIPLTSAPEVLNAESISNKSDIWSLGIIIYYMLFKEYPFNGESEEDILKEIDSNKKLNDIKDNNLNDLISKMLIKDENERISWNDYFNHPFFKKNNTIKKDEIHFNLPQFNFLCSKHSKEFESYCNNCKCNLCEMCFNEHNSHKIIPFCNIGLTNVESNLIKKLIGQIDENLNYFNKMKNDIQNLFNKMEKIKDNSSIYFDDTVNNYKEFYIECLNVMNNQIQNFKNFEKVKIIDVEKKDILKLQKEEEEKKKKEEEEKKKKDETEKKIIKAFHHKLHAKRFSKANKIKPKKEEKKIEEEKYDEKNFIICEYDIKEIDEPVQILNCFEEANCSNEGLENEQELRDNCILYLNDQKIDFCFKYEFKKEGKYIIKIICKKPLKTTNYMFCECTTLTSVDLSNFNTSKVTNMSHMFRKCSSLIFLNLSSFNTNNVLNMSYMFRECSSLTNLNLVNFNTEKVTNMSYMFLECSNLVVLNIKNFNTSQVINMESMFFKCGSLKELDITNFKTDNVINMSWMFSDCSSLSDINLKNFVTDNVINMGSMFSHCTTLKNLDLSNFNNSKVEKMSWMFSHCSSLENLDISNFELNASCDVNYMFSSMNKTCNVICKNQKLLEMSKDV